ncbi:MAG: XdhC family protein [Anderseniella sp.]|jgi:xanthine dehydrogenase accessory factor|nr:XdhC family protein [Anderseniella sp.]
MDVQLLKQLAQARDKRMAVAVLTDLATAEQELVTRRYAGEHALAAQLDEAFRFDKSGVVSTDNGEIFIHVHNPALRLVIIGAVHIAQAVAPMARQAGYDITVIDPRGAFATAERFPGVTLHADWPDEVLPGMALDARTAFIALTHDPKIDDPALTIALGSECFYIGALGSKKTQAARHERLKAAGLDPTRICGPIGLDIGARGAPEIAISIMAEMTRHLRLSGGKS